jgi:hypothetical protein
MMKDTNIQQFEVGIYSPKTKEVEVQKTDVLADAIEIMKAEVEKGNVCQMFDRFADLSRTDHWVMVEGVLTGHGKRTAKLVDGTDGPVRDIDREGNKCDTCPVRSVCQPEGKSHEPKPKKDREPSPGENIMAAIAELLGGGDKNHGCHIEMVKRHDGELLFLHCELGSRHTKPYWAMRNDGASIHMEELGDGERLRVWIECDGGDVFEEGEIDSDEQQFQDLVGPMIFRYAKTVKERGE